MIRKESHWRDSSAVFDQRAQEYNSWFDKSLLFDIELSAIRAVTRPVSGPALEIGVGPGRFAEALSSDFGIDPAFAPLDIAKSRNISVCQAIGEALPFRNNSCARVSLFFTLCFVQKPQEVIAETHRILQRNGCLLLGFVPAGSSWGKSLHQKKENGNPFYEHAHFFSVKGIKNLLMEQDFTLTRSVSTLYQAPGKVSKKETPQSGIDEHAGFVVIASTKTIGP